jgi:hypothetical protein
VTTDLERKSPAAPETINRPSDMIALSGVVVFQLLGELRMDNPFVVLETQEASGCVALEVRATELDQEQPVLWQNVSALRTPRFNEPSILPRCLNCRRTFAQRINYQAAAKAAR